MLVLHTMFSFTMIAEHGGGRGAAPVLKLLNFLNICARNPQAGIEFLFKILKIFSPTGFYIQYMYIGRHSQISFMLSVDTIDI